VHTFIAGETDAGSVSDIIAWQNDLNDFRVLIDTGRIVNASNGEAVSRKMLAWISQKNQARGASERIDVHAVMFSRHIRITQAERIA
jgi:hypothetical protein